MPSEGSTLVLAFEAKDVFLVMRASEKGRIKVYLDDKLVGEGVSGKDIAKSQTTVDVDRLYELVKLDKPGQHVLKLEFLDPGIELYAFTFG